MNASEDLQIMFDLKTEDDYPPYNDKFELLGYSTSNSMINIGTPMFMMMAYFALMLIYFIIYKLPF